MENSISNMIRKMTPEQLIQLSKWYLQVDLSYTEAQQIIPLIQQNASDLLNESTRRRTIEATKKQLPATLSSKIDRILQSLSLLK